MRSIGVVLEVRTNKSERTKDLNFILNYLMEVIN